MLKTRIACLFAGQGAQYPNMMHDLYIAFPEVKHVFDVADEVLGRCITKLCFEGTQEELNLTHNTQPCVLVADLAAYEAAKSIGLNPDAIAGFSLGEYAALVASGVIALEDAIRIIQVRADAMQDAVPVGAGGMVAFMKCSDVEVEGLCREVAGYVVPVNYNCPGQIVVSGEIEGINSILSLAKEKHIRAVKLPVSAPFHCKMMEPAREKLIEAFAHVRFSSPRIPIYMNVDSQKCLDENKIREKVLRQTVSPVLWEKTMKRLFLDGVDSFVELGPGKTLAGFAMKTLNNPDVISIGTVADIDQYQKKWER